MPYISLLEKTKSIIEIEIPDLEIAQTKIKRTAYCGNMEFDLNAKCVRLQWVVQHFAKNEDGTKGDYIGNTVPDYVREIIADNSTMCDVETGIPVSQDVDGNYPESIYYTPQFDYFFNLAEKHPIVVNSFIKKFGSIVDDWGKKK